MGIRSNNRKEKELAMTTLGVNDVLRFQRREITRVQTKSSIKRPNASITAQAMN